jgi:hypothetical protein
VYDQHLLRVNLIVKAPSPAAARRIVEQRLNEWFLEDADPPFEEGSLLLWWETETKQPIIEIGQIEEVVHENRPD